MRKAALLLAVLAGLVVCTPSQTPQATATVPYCLDKAHGLFHPCHNMKAELDV